MKKILFIVLAIVLMTSSSFADVIGLGVKGGIGRNSPKSFKEAVNTYGGDLTKNPLFFGIEGLYEMDLGGQYDREVGAPVKLGIKLSADFFGKNKIKDSPYLLDEKEYTVIIPMSLYLKYDTGASDLSFYMGGGMSYVSTSLTYGAADDRDWKFSPHALAGVELRVSSSVALGLDFQYNFNAQIKKSGMIYSDRSGLRGAFSVRFYL
ncbi:MAG: outer membrane beta-barrel protein [Elusimicrobiaceae bacterium]|nr:outer membrane beta-barrel protein [Elusimicrobiaceae bacterium]